MKPEFVYDELSYLSFIFLHMAPHILRAKVLIEQTRRFIYDVYTLTQISYITKTNIL